ncbi:MAG: peptide chain release factor 3 [Spirochaetales bacterium]|nr:peptide chain release factor 3 [Spirochaetales bacterium]
MSSEKIKAEIERRRSFAIIAHPDAGKTTLTEKLLLYGGAIQLAGHVRARRDGKTTRSDWMTIEKERGISISTAALQFEYNNCVFNLLDTPGHQDFSEDTYRTLLAADCAVMLLDGARGVEPQTIKLFHVCRERNIPVVTFINKMDRPARDPFELLDEVEKVLAITAVPILWPMGSGQDFKGVYDILAKQVYSFERVQGGAFKAPFHVKGLDDPELKSMMYTEDYDRFMEGLDLVREALPPFEESAFLSCQITPVFFGSAVTNFGIELFLNHFMAMAPRPGPVRLADGKSLSPAEAGFAAFVFKLQANMNQKHRDRVAFVRILSGAFERGMNANLARLQKSVRLNSPVAFFGQERTTIDEAFAGDIIGLINPGTYKLGDILSSGPDVGLPPFPIFAPEMFARIIPLDTGKLKAFRKGLTELAEEGVVQVFSMADGSSVIGAVGQLQFEVFSRRLEEEYGAPNRIETLAYECSRWTREEDLQHFSSYDLLARDAEGRPIVFFKSQYRLNNLIKEKPNLALFEHPPISMKST